MARKNNLSLLINSIIEQKKIKKDEIKEILENVFEKLYLKKFDPDANVKAVADIKTGDIELSVEKEIVENVVDIYTEISSDDPYVKKNKFKKGTKEMIPFDINDLPESAFNQIKQMFRQNLKEREDNITFEKYEPFVGKIIRAKIYRVNNSSVLATLDENDTVAYMSKIDMIRNEKYEVEQSLDFYVLSVDKISKDSQIKISRSHPELLRKLIEREINEVRDGTIKIHDVARIAGERAKVSVSTTSKEIDPVGSIIGPRGANAKKISDLLLGERIDVIKYHDDEIKYIVESLSPAKVIGVKHLKNTSVEKNDSKFALAVVSDSELVQAIGKGGINVKLSVKLTGYNIDIKSESRALEENISYEHNGNFNRGEYNSAKEQIEIIDDSEISELSEDFGLNSEMEYDSSENRTISSKRDSDDDDLLDIEEIY